MAKKRMVVIAVMVGVLAGALRIWSDYSYATFWKRHPDLGHHALLYHYHPLGQSLEFLVNLPVAAVLNVYADSPLGGYGEPNLSAGAWARELGHGFLDMLLTAILWSLILFGCAAAYSRKARRYIWALLTTACGIASSYLTWLCVRTLLGEVTRAGWYLQSWHTTSFDLLQSEFANLFVVLSATAWCIAITMILFKSALLQERLHRSEATASP